MTLVPLHRRISTPRWPARRVQECPRLELASEPANTPSLVFCDAQCRTGPRLSTPSPTGSDPNTTHCGPQLPHSVNARLARGDVVAGGCRAAA
jgi:hypothetical protein